VSITWSHVFARIVDSSVFYWCVGTFVSKPLTVTLGDSHTQNSIHNKLQLVIIGEVNHLVQAVMVQERLREEIERAALTTFDPSVFAGKREQGSCGRAQNPCH
jgi:hypothetical protein